MLSARKSLSSLLCMHPVRAVLVFFLLFHDKCFLPYFSNFVCVLNFLSRAAAKPPRTNVFVHEGLFLAFPILELSNVEPNKIISPFPFPCTVRAFHICRTHFQKINRECVNQTRIRPVVYAVERSIRKVPDIALVHSKHTGRC